jgi:hypothetical protein
LNEEILCRLAQKAFENRQDGLWPALKIGELALTGIQTQQVGSGWLSKSASWLWPAFKLGELGLAGFQNRRVGSGRLSKALDTAPRNLLPESNRSKGFELAGFEKLFANSKAFCAKRQKNN